MNIFLLFFEIEDKMSESYLDYLTGNRYNIPLNDYGNPSPIHLYETSPNVYNFRQNENPDVIRYYQDLEGSVTIIFHKQIQGREFIFKVIDINEFEDKLVQPIWNPFEVLNYLVENMPHHPVKTTRFWMRNKYKNQAYITLTILHNNYNLVARPDGKWDIYETMYNENPILSALSSDQIKRFVARVPEIIHIFAWYDDQDGYIFHNLDDEEEISTRVLQKSYRAYLQRRKQRKININNQIELLPPQAFGNNLLPMGGIEYQKAKIHFNS